MWAENMRGDNFTTKFDPQSVWNYLKQKYYKQDKIVVLEFAAIL